jgi:putative hemolysin
LSFITAQSGCANNATMPILSPLEGQVRDAGVLASAPVLAGLPPFAGKWLPLEEAQELYERARNCGDGFVLENLLREMDVDLRVDDADIMRIPKKGPVVVVANHPYGMLDGAVLAVLLGRVRPDVKVMTNFLLEGVPELEEHCIFVDPLHTPGSAERNRKALKQGLAWLHRGGVLAIFPAGEVSHWQMPQAAIADPQWNDTAIRLIRKTGAVALPVYFCGRNSLGFQLMGMIHPRLRMAFLLQEFLQQSGKSVALRVGSAIPADSIASIAGDREATEYLRWRTYLLAQRGKRQIRLPDALRAVLQPKPGEAITPALPPELLLCDLEALPAERCLVENAEFAVYAAQASEIPNLLQEVGRLREVTFRAAGEGTGRRSDLDRFDRYYWHLLLWSKAKNELVGGYRAGNTAEIVADHGVSGLYTSTLFRYNERLFEKLGPALELGRSFVRPEYQRQYAPLLLLWKAIARFVILRPETAVLFGAVSISNTYSRASRELMYSFFEDRKCGDELAGLATPRKPFRPGRIRSWDCRAVCHVLRDLEELSKPIADVEEDGKGLPILLKQYAKVGGKLLGFNVDRKFSDVLDGLVVVDLRQTEPVVLERYMGREGVAGFRRCHGLA